MWSDRGTNLTGTDNAMKKLDWNKIKKMTATMQIDWNFSPPKGPWWGGWWEKLMHLLKNSLKRELGKACLHYEEMLTVLCDIESVINERLLT